MGVAIKGGSPVNARVVSAGIMLDDILDDPQAREGNFIQFVEACSRAGFGAGSVVPFSWLLSVGFQTNHSALMWITKQAVHCFAVLVESRWSSSRLSTTPPESNGRIAGPGRQVDRDIIEHNLLAPVDGSSSGVGGRGRFITGARDGVAEALAKYFMGAREWFAGASDISVAVDATKLGRVEMLHGVVFARKGNEHHTMVAAPQVPTATNRWILVFCFLDFWTKFFEKLALRVRFSHLSAK
jgi:hypothetical protein